MVKKFINNIILEYINEKSFFDKHLYHGTNKGAALRIQKDGHMKPNMTGEVKPSISFTDDINYANYYANAKGGGDKSIILRTKLSNKFQLSPRIRNNSGDEYIAFKPISSNDLEILIPSGEWKPLNNWDVVFNEPK